ncbi:MAG TPA: serine hydrolase, partial [Deinococcales bacterium]|nr:serine hydrolase [Deinococcales bacterium]
MAASETQANVEAAAPEARCAASAPTTLVPAAAIPREITGRVGLYVARLSSEPGFNPVAAVALRPDETFPIASVFKQAILLELLRQHGQGALHLGERFPVTAANQSLGDYPYDRSTAIDLARRMIQSSDNTATDILFRRVGLDALQRRADDLALCRTRLALPTKAWWAAQAGLSPDFPPDALVSSTERFAKATPEDRLAIAQRLDSVAQQVGPERLRLRLEKGYFSGKNGPPETMSLIDRNLQNASTPEEWARFMAHEFTDNGLSPADNRTFRDVMALGYGRRRIQVPFSYFGGKEGNTAHVLALSG